MSHIFISYSKTDIDFARQLRSSLQSQGFAVWMDETRLAASERWWQTIEQNILSCSAFIVIMSPNSRKSRWVEREILVAERTDVDKRIFPVLLAGDVWSRLADVQYEDMSRGLILRQEFINALRQVVPQSNSPAPPPLSDDPSTQRRFLPQRARGRSTPLMLGLFALLIMAGLVIILNLRQQTSISPSSTFIPPTRATLLVGLAAATFAPTTTIPTLVPTTALPTTTIPTLMPTTALPTLTPTAVMPTEPLTNTLTSTMSGPTAFPANFPTPVILRLRANEQQFERGRMYWRQGFNYIWVMWYSTTESGSWASYADTYQSSEPWIDPNLVPPANRFQPEQGFGKLWRETGNLRTSLGWAMNGENYYDGDYEYHAGGSVDASGNYTRGQGYYLLSIFSGETIRFNDDYTWEMVD